MKNKNISYVNTYTVKEQKIQKKDKIFLLVLYHPSQKYKIIKRCCIFYFENQSKMSKFSGGLRPPDPPLALVSLKISFENSSDPLFIRFRYVKSSRNLTVMHTYLFPWTKP